MPCTGSRNKHRWSLKRTTLFFNRCLLVCFRDSDTALDTAAISHNCRSRVCLVLSHAQPSYITIEIAASWDLDKWECQLSNQSHTSPGRRSTGRPAVSESGVRVEDKGAEATTKISTKMRPAWGSSVDILISGDIHCALKKTTP